MLTQILGFAAGCLVGFMINEVRLGKQIEKLMREIRTGKRVPEPSMWEKPPVPTRTRPTPPPPADIFTSERQRYVDSQKPFALSGDRGMDL